MSALFHVEALADKTVEMLRVAPGQVISLWASTASLDLLQALAFRIRAHGAFWTTRLIFEPLLQRIGQEVPEQYLPLVPEHELRWMSDISAIVEVRDHGGRVPDVPIARRRAMASEWIALIDAAAHRGVRRVHVVNPTQSLADAYGIPLVRLTELLGRAMNVDYTSVDQTQERAAARLSGTKEVKITSALGTDLSLNIAGRPVLCDKDSLPHGEVYVAPNEDSANGIAVFERVFVRGLPIEHLRLTFENGKVVGVDAPDARAAASLEELLAVSTGEKDRIAELGIGLNPGVTEPVGIIALDEKIDGSIHIAIGMNESFGGKNKSNMHLDMVMLSPTLTLDGVRWF